MRPPYPLVFASSFSVLSFELLLIRIFSIRLSCHYASLIISLSMAGLVLFIVLCVFPFFLYGVIISLPSQPWKERANKIYASNLLGGAVGLLVVVVLMNYVKVV